MSQRSGGLLRPRRAADEADTVAVGVRHVAKQIAAVTRPGFLYFTATTLYLAERMATAVCQQHGVPVDRRDDVAAYLTSALQEYVTALVGDFDLKHFEAWIAAQEDQAGV